MNAASASGRRLRMRTSLPTDRAQPLVKAKRLYVVAGWGLRARRSLRDEAANENVEDRREQQAEERHAEHAGEHRDSHHAAHLGASAVRDDERRYARDERERRHENRAQSDAAGLQG